MVYFKKIAAVGKYHDDQAIPDVVAYITRKDKTPSRIILGYHVDMLDIANCMIEVSKHFGKYSRIRLHHFILTFRPVDASLIPLIAHEICAYIGRTYQVVAAQHEDTPNPHLHIVFNAVSYVNGYRYRGGKSVVINGKIPPPQIWINHAFQLYIIFMEQPHGAFCPMRNFYVMEIIPSERNDNLQCLRHAASAGGTDSVSRQFALCQLSEHRNCPLCPVR